MKPIVEEVRASGLIVSDDKTDPVQKGIVISAGEEVDESVKEGMTLWFQGGRDWEVEIEGEKYIYIEDQYALLIEQPNERTTQTSKSNTTRESVS